MSSNRAISPNEFRIKYRKFNIEYSPYNYFEKYRFELVLQNIGYWFYKYFGLYFYFQKIRIFENFVLIHFYYYKMHTHSIFSRKFQKDIKGRAVNDVDLL